MAIIIGFDLETTGLLEPDTHGENRIIELAALLYDERGTLKNKIVRRFNPGRPIGAKATEVHGIVFEMVAMEPMFQDLAEKITPILRAADLIVAHNGLGFDMPFYNKEIISLGMAPLSKEKFFDTMIASPWATFYGKSPNLGELCFALDVDYDPSKAHAAEYDVDCMMKCYFEGVRRGVYPQLATL
ncbi:MULTISPECIES: 3'-5' exonuclease [Chromobacterium]|uniref:3'-5' exonuclease n=1 Tax=Chromobacterium phragmitis TaxID=2202141 RepID=A0ABV0J0W6_9NEIS|nr:3'-5' exonuclease [Chromobacterium sp. ASV23]